jgi:hypothetical protein
LHSVADQLLLLLLLLLLLILVKHIQHNTSGLSPRLWLL